jgi:hypothetical protein
LNWLVASGLTLATSDAALNPKYEAFKLFRNAALMGNNSAMVMLSTKLAGIDPVEAYSWKLVADRLTSEGQLEFYSRNKYDFQLSASDMARAQQRSQELTREMASRAPVVFPPD